ncbi:MAG: hypothetical protein ABIC04_08125 [Nanoarchaeota archaeon]
MHQTYMSPMETAKVDYVMALECVKGIIGEQQQADFSWRATTKVKPKKANTT